MPSSSSFPLSPGSPIAAPRPVCPAAPMNKNATSRVEAGQVSRYTAGPPPPLTHLDPAVLHLGRGIVRSRLVHPRQVPAIDRQTGGRVQHSGASAGGSTGQAGSNKQSSGEARQGLASLLTWRRRRGCRSLSAAEHTRAETRNTGTTQDVTQERIEQRDRAEQSTGREERGGRRTSGSSTSAPM